MRDTIEHFKYKLNNASIVLFFAVMGYFAATPALAQVNCVGIDQKILGFEIPTLGQVLTFLIRFFFIVAGLIALFYLLLGALAYITSSGSKEGTEKARDKIQAAVIGVILIVVVLAIIVTLEQVVFSQSICFGISCPIKITPLVKSTNSLPNCN